jgi:AcrR family transcriptional regulator
MDELNSPIIAPRRRKKRKNARKKSPDAPSTKRGEIAREKLKKATAKLLEKKSYRDLTLADIVGAAKYNIATFYYYFKDKQSIVREVIQDLFPHDSLVPEYRRHSIALEELFTVIFETTRGQTVAYAQHPGLMRSIAQFADDEPELAEMIHRRDQLWTDLIAEDILSRFSSGGISPAFAHSLADMLNGAVKSFLTDLYVLKKPALTKAFRSEDEVARFLAIFWWRALFLANPDPTQLGRFDEFIRLSAASSKPSA